MSRRRQCPKCSTPLEPPYIACLACPWTEGTSEGKTSTDVNRCAWEQDGQRCRYVATVFEGQIRGCQRGFCPGHYNCSPQSGAATIAESWQKVPEGFDYSTANIVKLTRERYESRSHYADDA